MLETKIVSPNDLRCKSVTFRYELPIMQFAGGLRESGNYAFDSKSFKIQHWGSMETCVVVILFNHLKDFVSNEGF